ncbi:MAG TPA: hypothetical protein VL547_04530 [Dinghuibacter sp.]|uniref:hypothetical protein n=1 Tax=Dinghuibacter sp. TaxID=2024697 RepID=UPI002CD82B56|nr:hypothetical protein [Dinghuibacter sp.]HTJ11261.1 hypothetical protein [Dinghuibacter sp.]
MNEKDAVNSNEKESENLISFDNVCKKFLRQIEGIRDTLPLVMLLISVNSTRASKDLLKFLKSKGVEGEKVKLENEDIHIFRSLEKNATTASTARDIIPVSLFVSMISQFDSFLGNLIRTIFSIRPEILNSSEKNLTFSKLLQINSIEEAKEFIVEKEVEAIIRESHTSHFEWLESKLGIPLRKDLPIWATFIEITERRNLFVHCDGHVSSQYLTICRNNKVVFEKEIALNDKLSVTAEYFEKSFRCLFEISVKLTQVIWRKLLSDDLENADQGLNTVCFDLLRNEEYDLADILLDFATRIIPRHHNAESKTIFVVNKAIAMKFGNIKGGCNHYLESMDWSAFNDKFRLAKEVLLENYEESVKIMKKIGAEGEIKKSDYKAWPLFTQFRETDLFQNAYREIFGEEFKAIETPTSMFDRLMEQIESSKVTKSEYGKEAEVEIETKENTEIHELAAVAAVEPIPLNPPSPN